ncbi:MAG TPA: 3-hydroxyacyl-CoA dehydrogenase NAD-binding domain-containing protein [Desulfotignum sp.]|nr:3-hydroxyacyl-CoA dehydrogenase NAD-binding domain-containing protein [Desulfotignum sp.]
MSQISKIGVIGAGHMGSGIAQKIAQEGMQVVLVDIKQSAVDNGIAGIRSLLEGGVKRGLFTPEKVAAILSRISGTTDMVDVADADIVIEAVFEDKTVKTTLFKNLDKVCKDAAIFATNTSSFYVHEFANQTRRPDRFIGLHYFFHPAKNKLLEIIPHDTTSQQTIDTARAFAARHGKVAIVVKDSPGFAVNRFFVPSSNEAARMLEEGMGNVATIEEASKRAFGIGMGSFEILNVTGIPLAVNASQSLGSELGLFYGTPDMMRTQMETGKDWDLADGPVDEDRIDAIVDRFYSVCLGAAAALVDEGVATMEDVNLGAKIGLRWREGPFEIMNRIGIDRACRVVEQAVKRYPGFTMPGILADQKAKGQPFEFKLVSLEKKQDTAWITIRRPDAMNALNEAVFNQLARAFDAAENDPDIRSIVFQGEGKTFVAGADIQFFVDRIKAGRIDHIETFTRQGHDLLWKVENSPKKTIALLDGLSLGGGSEMALACRYIVATPAGSMGLPETGIGIVPGLGGMLRMARRVGPALARYFVFTGQTLSAQDAFDLGLVQRIVDPGDIETAIRELTDRADNRDKYASRPVPERFAPLAELFAGKQMNGWDHVPAAVKKMLDRKSPRALAMADRIMTAQEGLSMDAAVACELDCLKELFSTADAFEGLSAAASHRKPVFTGK